MKRRIRQQLQATLGEHLTERLHGMYRATLAPASIIRSVAIPELRESGSRLRAMRNQFQGKRCFIIGNGPSLNKTDLTKLKDEYTFGLNRIYLAFERTGFSTTFLVVINKYVIEQIGKELTDISTRKFINWSAHEHVTPGKDVIYVQTDQVNGFSDRPDLFGVRTSATVTCVALQLAYYLGFSEVILIGVDHSFSTSGAPHKLVTSTGDDPNHFDPSYFGKGFRWQLPDLHQSEIGYAEMKKIFEDAGRQVLDATVDGQLQVFPKVPYGSLFIDSTTSHDA